MICGTQTTTAEIRKEYFNSRQKQIAMPNKFKTVSLNTMIDKHIGKRGTEKREVFEKEVRIDLSGQVKKQRRQNPDFPSSKVPGS